MTVPGRRLRGVQFSRQPRNFVNGAEEAAPYEDLRSPRRWLPSNPPPTPRHSLRARSQPCATLLFPSPPESISALVRTSSTQKKFREGGKYVHLRQVPD